jgi:diguanylate cyclase (GGDEF)-like protein
VLSPFLGGWYFGGILIGIVRAGAEAGANIVAVQTLDAGTEQIEISEPPDLAHPIGLRYTSGVIAIINAASAGHLATIQGTGRPVVVVSHQFADLDCPVVLADNYSGIREAVTHLIDHGHRRIAFVGFFGAEDVRQRYDAYCRTLREHQITPDPRLVFEVDENLQAGGERAGRAMIEAGLPSTAVIAATDANAIGVMEVLTAAGCRLPDDQAIIGFDDLRAACYTTPRLSTVKQSLEQLGRTAVDVLASQIREGEGERQRAGGRGSEGERAGGHRHLVPTTLIIRESCGCSGETTRRPAGAAARPGQREFRDRTYLEDTLSRQYEVSMDLLRSHEADPQRLGWLARTSADAGCLGLWTPGGRQVDAATLDIAGTFLRGGPALPPLGQTLHVTEFPPAGLVAAAQARTDGLVLVVPVKVNDSNWGLLAVADTVDTRVSTGREPVNHWAALLAVALEHRAVLRELRQREDQLRVAALYDHLTGLPNRTLFLDRLRQAIQRTKRRPGGLFGVLFLDLDGFKVVNDSLGHSVGDRLLVQVAERLTEVLRESDTAARYGGDEFLILLDEIDEPYAPSMVAERILTALGDPFELDGQDLVITASIGITMGGPRYQHADDLLRDADIAMYWAKSQGKGTYALFDVEMHTRAVSRLTLETELRQALERHELEVHYQPVVHLPTGRTCGFEALLRWQHPVGGLTSPAEFLPVAEETGLIIPFGRWVFDESCRQLAEWHARTGQSDLWMSVNVSNRQFWSGSLVDDIGGALRFNAVDPQRVALEITEGVIMHNVERARGILQALHALGCRLLIDDFGTGYSSLEALHDLPIDGLKIDRSFVSRLGTNTRSGELVRTIALMSANLDLDLVAEGIETEFQRDRLMQLGCTYGQGYLLARPGPAEAAAGLIAAPAMPR